MLAVSKFSVLTRNLELKVQYLLIKKTMLEKWDKFSNSVYVDSNKSETTVLLS